MSETDLISRQAAIEVIDAVFPVDPMKSEYAQGIACGAALAKTYVEQLPYAQSERKKGKWIPVTRIYKVTEEQFPNTHIEWVDATEPDEIDGVRCSECDTVYDFIEARNWCSECGADMRGEQE